MKKKPHRVSGLEDHIVHCVVLREFFLTVACAFRTQVHITFFLLFFPLHQLLSYSYYYLYFASFSTIVLFIFCAVALSLSRSHIVKSLLCVRVSIVTSLNVCILFFFSEFTAIE